MALSKNHHLKKLKNKIANFLIFSSLVTLIFIYVPILKAYFPHNTNVPTEASFSISIPKIGAQAPIIPNVDPFNELEYRQALTKGVAQAKDTALPDQNGTMFLFAHSSDAPWRLSQYNTVFLRLGELKKGDQIIIRKDGNTYIYEVTETKTVWPNEVQYLTKSGQKQLIIQTCTPLGTSLKRLLVFAKPA